MERYPDGYRGKSFFRKDVPGHFPDRIHRREVPKEGGAVTMAVCGDAATLAYLANQACLTLHPWLSRTDRLDCPDRIVFDLDPPADDFDTARAFARDVAGLLAARHPDELTTAVRKDKRRGRLCLDIQRTAYAQTSVAPYAVRARPHAPVATPIGWDELDAPDLHPQRWTVRTLPDRLAGEGTA